EGIPAGHLLEHDAALALAIAIRHQPERGLDALLGLAGAGGELLKRQRLRGDHQQGLDRPPEPVDRTSDEIELRRIAHEAERLATASAYPARQTEIGWNGSLCPSVISPDLRSSSRARKATICSIRPSARVS